jgi:hypothetical protein
MRVGGQRHALAALPLGKTPDTHCIGGWVGPRAGLDGCENLAPTGIFFLLVRGFFPFDPFLYCLNPFVLHVTSRSI